jgi:N-methylhydantoinase B
MSYLKNTPVEINEAEVPVRILRYGLVPDSGGAGRWRGGSALEMEFQLFAPQSMVTARNRDRSIFSAWGLRGGLPGKVSRFARNPDTDRCVELGSTDIVPCDPGDIILIQGPGAGGYGDPLDRPVEDVLTDVRRGFISAARARSDYGVVVGDALVVDAVATARLRDEMARRQVITEFGHGEGRIAFERVWTQPRYAALTRILSEVPVTWRYFVKHSVFGALKDMAAPADGGAADVYRAYAAVAARFDDLPRFSAQETHAAVAAE